MLRKERSFILAATNTRLPSDAAVVGYSGKILIGSRICGKSFNFLKYI